MLGEEESCMEQDGAGTLTDCKWELVPSAQYGACVEMEPLLQRVNLGNPYCKEASLFQLEREGSLTYTEISQGHLLITLAFNYLSLICYMTLSKSFILCVCIYV